MKQIIIKLPVFKETLARNEREEILLDILGRINNSRTGTTFKPLRFIVIKQKVQHLDNWDLKFFYNECLKAKVFSKHFFGLLKAR